MKKMFVLTLILSVFLFACTEKGDFGPEKFEPIVDLCQTDNDCVPLPGCHPRECINIAYEGDYEQPEVCTMMFDNEAAYNAEDCVCVNRKCENSLQ